MIKIVTLYILLLSFCLKAQVNNNDIKVLQDEISTYKNLGDTTNGNYMSNLNKLYKIFILNTHILHKIIQNMTLFKLNYLEFLPNLLSL